MDRKRRSKKLERLQPNRVVNEVQSIRSKRPVVKLSFHANPVERLRELEHLWAKVRLWMLVIALFGSSSPFFFHGSRGLREGSRKSARSGLGKSKALQAAENRRLAQQAEEDKRLIPKLEHKIIKQNEREIIIIDDSSDEEKLVRRKKLGEESRDDDEEVVEVTGGGCGNARDWERIMQEASSQVDQRPVCGGEDWEDILSRAVLVISDSESNTESDAEVIVSKGKGKCI